MSRIHTLHGYAQTTQHPRYWRWWSDNFRGGWQHRYGYRLLLLETFVEKDRLTGVCYRAANWLHVGQTQGRGKLGPSGKQSIPIKDVWLYPLGKGFKNGLIR